MAVRVPFSSLYGADTEFDVADGDLTHLEIRPAKDKLFYFYDRVEHRLAAPTRSRSDVRPDATSAGDGRP